MEPEGSFYKCPSPVPILSQICPSSIVPKTTHNCAWKVDLFPTGKGVGRHPHT